MSDMLRAAILGYMAHEASWRGARCYSPKEADLWQRRAVALGRAARGEDPRCSCCGRIVHVGAPCEVYR